ncbi:thioesterase family protein [Pseudothermotoga thermarum]|uniref:Thioesterase superfamily protein n=1 Tax=Pseudothermotoga thermarum DSM 5069 TaxID=688269 RepID=F7YWK9_9THEM|nr:hotdog domain-containing protein [Pseudothermotoga thermarum]AEH51990.1 thioesterase superfamily protein [Pseudothermotoga thermarum DSM 5069]
MISLEQLVGKSQTVEVKIDESCLWNEDQEMSLFHFASTSGLCALLFHVAFNLIQPFLDENIVNVVVEANVRHLNPVKVGEVVAAGIRVVDVSGNRIKFRGIIMKGETKILEAEFVRCVVSRNYLRRLSVEKTS